MRTFYQSASSAIPLTACRHVVFLWILVGYLRLCFSPALRCHINCVCVIMPPWQHLKKKWNEGNGSVTACCSPTAKHEVAVELHDRLLYKWQIIYKKNSRWLVYLKLQVVKTLLKVKMSINELSQKIKNLILKWMSRSVLIRGMK